MPTRISSSPALSDAHGRIDVSNTFWNIRGEDHHDDPLTIPTLRGVKTKPRLGHDGRTASLREFTRRVIVTEFGGDEPDPTLLDALVAYQETLRPVAAKDQPVTLAGDLADIVRHLDTLAVPLAEESPALSDTIATMIRGQLGFISERLDGDDLAPAREIVAGWSRELQQSANWPASAAGARRASAVPPCRRR